MLLNALGMHIHPTKGHLVATLMGDHLGMTLDFEKGVFRFPKAKLDSIPALAK